MKKLHSILLIIIILSLTSCKDWLDINVDPNRPTEVEVELVLPAAQASVAVVVGGEYHNLGGFFAQYWTQAPEAQQYQRQDTYDLRTTDSQEQYQELYAGALNDFEYIKNVSIEKEDLGDYLVATVMKVYTFQVLADLYDKIPYTEALKGTEIIAPKWDEGELVYQSLVDSLDAALAKDYSNASISPTDLFFEGDIDQWLRMANSVKLKLLMRQCYAKDVESQVESLLQEDRFITQDVAMTQFEDVINKRNPWFEVEVDRLGTGITSINHIASHTLVTYLELNGDPRMENFYLPSVAEGIINGNYPGTAKNGEDKDGDETDYYSLIAADPLDPAYIMSIAEVQLLIAEAHARYTGNNDAARSAYEAAIDANFAQHGLTGSEDMYGPGGPYEWQALTGNVEDDIKQIMMQKWVCLAKFQHFEGWTEMRRTKYPQKSSVPGSDLGYVPGEILEPGENKIGPGLFPGRLWYPDLAVARNPNTPAQPTNISVKVWWDKK